MDISLRLSHLTFGINIDVGFTSKVTSWRKSRNYAGTYCNYGKKNIRNGKVDAIITGRCNYYISPKEVGKQYFRVTNDFYLMELTMMKGGARVRLDLDEGWCETLHYITIHQKRTDFDEGWCETLHYTTIQDRTDLDEGWCETLYYITIHQKRTDFDVGWCETFNYISIHQERTDLDEGWQHQMTTIMQPFQCDLPPQLQKAQRTTHTGTTTRCKPHRRNNSRQKRPQPQPPHRRGTFHRRLQPLYTEKRKVSCSGFYPKHSPCNIHAAITMSFAASRSKPAPIYGRGNTK